MVGGAAEGLPEPAPPDVPGEGGADEPPQATRVISAPHTTAVTKYERAIVTVYLQSGARTVWPESRRPRVSQGSYGDGV